MRATETNMSQTCAHAACRCAVEPGQVYCSPHCANAGTEMPAHVEERCGCGHAACGADAGRTVPVRTPES